jgi:ABC-2 type transport system permease protein
MSAINTFFYEFKHFTRSKAKVFAYLLFVVATAYSLYSGFDLQKKQRETINNIEKKKQENIEKVLLWFEKGEKGPQESSWVDITTPYWALSYLPTYVIKQPSSTFPLGIGQAEQYGYYKQVTNRSSVYDSDMVEELANPERLVNGTIDFSFLVIFLLPMVLIILTYNINGLEKDLNFDKLIAIQSGNTKKWILSRLGFYCFILIATVLVFILAVAALNQALYTKIFALIALSSLYIIAWMFIFYIIILKSNSSSTIAFKMISIWLIFCVLIPGAVHQMASVKYPTNLMTDYLDANRKEAYKVYELSADTLSNKIKSIYPNLIKTKHGLDTIPDQDIVGNSISAIINQMNKTTISKIELQNDTKNTFIKSSYWFNPITLIQNKWNNITETDYYAYKAYRNILQQKIDQKIELLVFESWEKKKINKKTYENYFILLK